MKLFLMYNVILDVLFYLVDTTLDFIQSIVHLVI
jgi:hypothetical protein